MNVFFIVSDVAAVVSLVESSFDSSCYSRMDMFCFYLTTVKFDF